MVGRHGEAARPGRYCECGELWRGFGGFLVGGSAHALAAAGVVAHFCVRQQG